MKEKFFYENDVKVTKMAVKVLRWLILVFPADSFNNILSWSPIFFLKKIANVLIIVISPIPPICIITRITS